MDVEGEKASDVALNSMLEARMGWGSSIELS